MFAQHSQPEKKQSLSQWKKKITTELKELWSQEEVNIVFQTINRLEQQGRTFDTIRCVVDSSCFGGAL